MGRDAQLAARDLKPRKKPITYLVFLLQYQPRQRSDFFTLPSEDNNLIRKNFLLRMLLRDIYCVIAFHFTILMYLLRTLHPILRCICMYVDVMVCVCQT